MEARAVAADKEREDRHEEKRKLLLEIGEKEAKIEELQDDVANAIKQKDESVIAFEQQIRGKNSEIDRLQASIRNGEIELEKRKRDLTAVVEAMEKDMAELLAKKGDASASEVEELKNRLDKRDVEVGELQAALASGSSELNRVKGEHERLVSDLRQELAAKASEVQRLAEKSSGSDDMTKMMIESITSELDEAKKQLAAAQQTNAALRDSTNELAALVEAGEKSIQTLEKDLQAKKVELASLAEALELLDVYAKKEAQWQETEKTLMQELSKLQSGGVHAEELMQVMSMLEDERKLRKELEIEAITIQDEFAKLATNLKTQTEIAELLEAENKKLEGQLLEVMQMLENK